MFAFRYIRAHGDDQDTSLTQQQERVDAYCTKRGYETSELFVDRLSTAVPWRERPGLILLMKRAQELAKQQAVCVIVDIAYRLGRGEELLIIVALLQEYGAQVEFVLKEV